MGPLPQFQGLFLGQGLALGGEVDDIRQGSALGDDVKVAAPDGFRLHDHALAAAVGGVVHPVVFGVGGVVPDVVAVDELGDREDTTALEQVLKCGCSVLATVHGGSYEELSRKRFLQPLLQAGAFQRYLVLKHCDGTFFVEQVRDGDGQLLASGLACCA